MNPSLIIHRLRELPNWNQVARNYNTLQKIGSIDTTLEIYAIDHYIKMRELTQ